MRLLQLLENGKFSLVEYVDKDLPKYAILSHTWGADHDEVTFQDLVQGTGKDKAGFQKLIFCQRQAAADGLHFIWVDTCCIDKSSSQELSEAINSMFRWYYNASRCYVYLLDVLNGDAAQFDEAFKRSRWFTRGWTLQELIAPRSVEFFASNGGILGDRISLLNQICDVTGIPVAALQGRPLSKFSIEERLSWAEKRNTKCEEDTAYCLLGIFNIHLPLIYGEGRESATTRLRYEVQRTSHQQFLHRKEDLAQSIENFDEYEQFFSQLRQLFVSQKVSFLQISNSPDQRTPVYEKRPLLITPKHGLESSSRFKEFSSFQANSPNNAIELRSKLVPLIGSDPKFEGKHVKGDQSYVIYLVLDQKLRQIASPTVWEALFGKGEWKFEIIPQALLDNCPKGAPLDETTFLIKGDSDPIYLIDEKRKRHIINPDVYNRYGFSWDTIMTISSLVDLIPNGPNIE